MKLLLYTQVASNRGQFLPDIKTPENVAVKMTLEIPKKIEDIHKKCNG